MERKRFLIPQYAYIPLGAALICNLAVYSGTKWITAGWPHHSMATALDAALPFLPAFIVIYVLAFAQWCIGYLMIARDSRALCYRVIAGDIVAKLICGVCFLAYPTMMRRPEIAGTGLLDALTRLIYSCDTPVNLFPSIHCLASWICFRGAMLSSKAAPWYKAVMLVFTFLVCASTVLVKQHVVLDIAGGILAAELGLFLSRSLRLGRMFARLESAFVKKTGVGEQSPRV